MVGSPEKLLKTCSAKDGDAGNEVLRGVRTSGDSRLARLISNVKEDRAEWRVLGMIVETYMDNALPKSGNGACRYGAQNCPLNCVNVALMNEQFWRPDQTTTPDWV